MSGNRSAVKRLPTEVRSTVEGWLKEFAAGRLTLDEVVARLDAQWTMIAPPDVPKPSRSSLHRHAQQLEKVGERIRRSQEMTAAFAEAVGPQVADGKGVQVMIQAVQSLVYDLLGSIEDGAGVDPKAIHDLAKAAHHMAAAQKTDADRALKIEAETRKRAAAEVKEACAERGLSDEVAEFLFARVLNLDK